MKISNLIPIVLIIVILVGISLTLIHINNTNQTQKLSSTNTTNNPEKPRIVSLAPSDTQILVSLGLGKDIVGMDIYSYQLLQTLNMTSMIPPNVTVITSVINLNITGIIALQPTVVVLEYGLSGSYIPQLENAGLKVLVTNSDYASNLENVINTISQIATFFNVTNQANQLIKWMNQSMVSYPQTNVSVAYFDWIDSDGTAYSIGNNVFINDLIDRAGGFNSFSNFTGYITVTPSQVLLADPHVIVAQEIYNYSYTIYLIHKYFNYTYAVKNNQVYVITGLATDVVDEPSILSVYAIPLFHDIITGVPVPHYISTNWFMTKLNITLPIFDQN
ncbi:ABC transporter substrate-binding protein [Sulfolobus acidocaldarius]|uniref:Conserved periplasmic binding protein n=4 Tax=Sulfolobus acidocaldarius TaxID=2285 RepID=Q4J9G4_SULAC|nr:ABC transporter substrate-binding protein [Sulfolobus acidocaldarius]AAY80566.1 conserved periplasmic binding protein [Sulfolobus acidocaldarius DSM 639]AGE71155.1 periplasmic binding protein [Sulfolobus acidocaldarius N8]AGE73425.1 periplasmic binding protein [Sulfolobus acidocaldarius Ron12/I]ALU28574.1 ABC transporter substrate-binding protein [Sulfolobus acidocaldarius]ALU31286.1 ABC transporter substrate-binding protein [Sulfolobus acidocaldarius]